jgi:hypothetical protein
MAVSLSLTLDDLHALLGLLESQDTLSPTFQTAASQLQIQALAQGFHLAPENSLLSPTSTPVQGPFPFWSEGVGTSQAQTMHALQGTSLPLTIRIPARCPRSPSLDMNENRHNDVLPDLQPVPQTAPKR